MTFQQAKELVSAHIKKNRHDFINHHEYGAAFSHFLQNPKSCPPFMGYKLFIECKNLILSKRLAGYGKIKKAAELAVEYQPYLQFIDTQIPFPPPEDPKFTFIDLFAVIYAYCIPRGL